VIGPSISTEGIILAEVLMSSLEGLPGLLAGRSRAKRWMKEGLSRSAALHAEAEEENGGGSGGQLDGWLRREKGSLVRCLMPGVSGGAAPGERRLQAAK
jgi:hypothetical protein